MEFFNTFGKHFTKKSFHGAVPYLILVTAIIFIVLGYFVKFETLPEEQAKTQNLVTFFRTVGLTALASGLFSFLIKSSQYSGVYKEELLSIMYDADHLSNRSDLPEIWENVSKVLFENKFPAISKMVTSDVKNSYFLVDAVLYYEDYEQTIEIELIDKVEQIIKVTQKSSYTIYPTQKGCDTPLTTNNTIRYGNKKEAVTFSLDKLLVNGVKQTMKPVEFIDKEKKLIRNSFSFNLTNTKKNIIEHVITKQYSLKTDCVIGTTKQAIVHNFSVMITHSEDLSIDFFDVGTVKTFSPRNITNKHVKEFKYKGLLYPKQGYMFVVKLNS